MSTDPSARVSLVPEHLHRLEEGKQLARIYLGLSEEERRLMPYYYARVLMERSAVGRVATPADRVRALIRFRLIVDPLVVVRWGVLLFGALMVLTGIGFALSSWGIGFIALAFAFTAWGVAGIFDSIVRVGRRDAPVLMDPRLSSLLIVGGLGMAATAFVALLT